MSRMLHYRLHANDCSAEERRCTSKARFPLPAQAEAVLAHMVQLGTAKPQTAVYQCPYDPTHWHLGRNLEGAP